MVNSTFTGNAAANHGGGIYLYGGTLTVGNSIVSGNNATNGNEVAANVPASSAEFVSQGHNLFGENGAAGLVNASPGASDKILAGAIGTAIGPLANNGGPTQTHLPVLGSPVIDAGDNALIPAGTTTDQRGAGFPRIVNGTMDIGAVEVGPFSTLTVWRVGTGNGAVTSSPVGIDCGTTCQADFPDGATVTLTGTAEAPTPLHARLVPGRLDRLPEPPRALQGGDRRCHRGHRHLHPHHHGRLRGCTRQLLGRGRHLRLARRRDHRGVRREQLLS
jgi:hypothetical protein